MYIYIVKKTDKVPSMLYQSANDLMVTHALGQMMHMIYSTHPTSVGFQRSVWYELLLTSYS